MSEQPLQDEQLSRRENTSSIERAKDALDAIEKRHPQQAIDTVTADLVHEVNDALMKERVSESEAEEALLVGELSVLAHHGTETPIQLAHSTEGLLAHTFVEIEKTKGVAQLDQLIEAIDRAAQQEKQDAATEDNEGLVERKHQAAEWIQEHTLVVERTRSPLDPPRRFEQFELDTEKIVEIPADLQEEIALNLLQRNGGAYVLSSVLDRFTVLPKEVGMAIIDKGYTTPLQYPEVFPDLRFTVEDAQSFIEAGDAYIPLSAADRFEGFQPNAELAETLFAEGRARTVLDNLEKFDGFVLEDTHREQLMQRREYSTLIDFSDEFAIKTDDSFAQELIAEGAVSDLSRKIRNFSGLSCSTVDTLLSENAVNLKSVFESLQNFELTEDDIVELALQQPSLNGIPELPSSLQSRILLEKMQDMSAGDEKSVDAFRALCYERDFRYMSIDKDVLMRMLEIDAPAVIYALNLLSDRPFEQVSGLAFDQAFMDTLTAHIRPEDWVHVIDHKILGQFPLGVRDNFVETIIKHNVFEYVTHYRGSVSDEMFQKIQRLEEERFNRSGSGSEAVHQKIGGIEEEFNTSQKYLKAVFEEFPGSDLESALRSGDERAFNSMLNGLIQKVPIDYLYENVLGVNGVEVPRSLQALRYLYQYISSDVLQRPVSDLMLDLMYNGRTSLLLSQLNDLEGVWSLSDLSSEDIENIQKHYLGRANYEFYHFNEILEYLDVRKLPLVTRRALEVFGPELSKEAIELLGSVLSGERSDDLTALGINSVGEEGVEALKQRLQGVRGAVLDNVFTLEADVTEFDTSVGIDVLRTATRYATAQWGVHSSESLQQLVETTKEVTKRGANTPLGPEYQVSDVAAIQSIDATKERAQWTEDAVSKYGSLLDELRQASELNRTPGSFNQSIRQLTGAVRELIQQHSNTIALGVDARGNALTEKGAFFLQKTVDELTSVSENLGSLRDFERNFSVLAKHKSLHGDIRQIVFAWALRMNPDWEFTIDSMQSQPNLTDTTRQIEFIDHIVNQETFSTYFENKQNAAKFREIVNAKSLTDALERQSQLSTISEKTIPLQFMPTRGLLMELSGHIGDACWANKYESIAEAMPNMTAVIMKQHPGEPSKEKFVGSAMLIETIDENTQEPTLVIRGLNPIENFINRVSPEGFFESFVSYARSIAEARGMKVGIVIDDHAGGSATNRPMLFGYLSAIKGRLSKIPVPAEGTAFNGYRITDSVYAL